jgi:hypothetical protein
MAAVDIWTAETQWAVVYGSLPNSTPNAQEALKVLSCKDSGKKTYTQKEKVADGHSEDSFPTTLIE